MKRVLLLGDSISMGYREHVRELLAGEADVQYMEENGRFAKYTMWAANQWIRNNGAPDIVHWNNGIWDITIEPPLEGSFTPLPDYITALSRMIGMFRSAGVSTVIFATTTYSHPEGSAMRPEAAIDLYNASAAALMACEGVEVNDLGGFQRKHLEEFLCEDGLHLNEKGYSACAQQVADAIRRHL